jgi:amidohydrolase
VSRQENLTIAPVVITVGKIQSGVRSNIIPEEATMEGTIRTLDPDMQKDVHERIKLTAQKIAEASGATVEVNIDTKTLVTYNDKELVEQMTPSLYAAAGKENVIQSEWTTGAEDFSFFGEKAPSFFFFLGGMKKGGDPKTTPAHHTPDFYIDDSRLDVGVKAFSNIVFDYAKIKSQTTGAATAPKKKGF